MAPLTPTARRLVRRPLPIAMSLAAVVLAAGCTARPPAPAAPAPATFAWESPTQSVGVAGTTMTLDGQPWRSRGVTLQFLVRPAADLRAHGGPALVAALDNYGPDELAAIKRFGADTLRFQVSQPALDPASPRHDTSYLRQVLDAVGLARSQGFVVLLMMQDEDITGEPAQHPTPTAATMTGWDQLNASLGHDDGVLYELYNEPRGSASPQNWRVWAQGDDAHGAVGVQTMISRLRAAGSRNTMVVDGLDGGKTLAGAPEPDDPLRRVVYAVHPYLGGSDDESGWDDEFGAPSRSRPVWVDEWSAGSGQKIGLGDLSSPQPAVDLVNYVRSHSLPLCAGAFDVPDFMVQDVPGWTYTTYADFAAPHRTHNAGALVHQLFVTHYARPLTIADGR